MMFRGRWQQGDEARVGVQCVDASGLPIAPTSAPTMTVYGAANDPVYGPVAIPPKNRANTTGFFEHFIRLDGAFPPGVYSVLYEWPITGPAVNEEVDHFVVNPGGDPVGTAISLYYFQAPQADFLVQQLDSGQIIAGKNPR